MFGSFAQPHILVLGLGETGVAITRWALAHGARVRIADSREAPAARETVAAQWPEVEIRCGAFGADLLDGIDLIGISPGLSPYREPTQGLLALAAERGIAVWSEIEFFAQALAHLKTESGYAPRVVGITGTNGKTTVTTLAAHLAQTAGLRAQAAGNISPAALDALSDALAREELPDFWAIELSSFQLETTHSLACDAAVILNVTEDHLDWHPSLQAYADAKGRLFAHAAVRIGNRQDAATMAQAGAGARSFGLDLPQEPGDFGLDANGGLRWLARIDGQTIVLNKKGKPVDPEAEPPRLVRMMPADALRIAGDHNIANTLAALMLVANAGVPLARALHGLRDFEGLPHRVQHVQTVAGIDYIDDSKGTNVGATVAALDGLRRKLVLIAGGDGKGQDFAPLREPIARWARAVVLIGRDAEPIAAVLNGCDGLVLERSATLPDAVRAAARLAQEGDAVLMSPACASLDMFRNYAHRAEVFVDTVRELALEAGELC